MNHDRGSRNKNFSWRLYLNFHFFTGYSKNFYKISILYCIWLPSSHKKPHSVMLHSNSFLTTSSLFSSSNIKWYLLGNSKYSTMQFIKEKTFKINPMEKFTMEAPFHFGINNINNISTEYIIQGVPRVLTGNLANAPLNNSKMKNLYWYKFSHLV